jgi:hypothetical protein
MNTPTLVGQTVHRNAARRHFRDDHEKNLRSSSRKHGLF